MNVILSLIYSVWFFACAAVFIPVCAVLALASPFFDPNKRLLNTLSAAFMNKVLQISPGWTLHIEGHEHLQGGPFVIVGNHQSFADIVIVHAIKHHYRWVSKHSVFFVPIFGWIMALNGHISIRRGDIKSTRHMMVECTRLLKNGVSVMMFPEGTRSPDGEVHEFREGPFRVARLARVPVVPIAIEGTHRALPKGAWYLNFDAPMYIKILEPMHVEDFDGDTCIMKEAVENKIKDAVSELRTKPVMSADAPHLVAQLLK